MSATIPSSPLADVHAAHEQAVSQAAKRVERLSRVVAVYPFGATYALSVAVDEHRAALAAWRTYALAKASERRVLERLEPAS